MAETYHIYDYEALQPVRVAVLCVGLRDNSRVKTALMGKKTTTENLLLAHIADKLSFLAWTKTKDAADGINRPKSILKMFLNVGESASEDVETFETSEEFERKKAILSGRMTDG